jgi:hypothetical protein
MFGLKSLQLNWTKSRAETWLNLLTVDLDDESLDLVEGVYVIWHGGDGPNVVRVGQGNIRDRLKSHKIDPVSFPIK